MDMRCPRCGVPAEFVGQEDGRVYYSCAACKRVWPSPLVPPDSRVPGEPFARVLVADDSESTVQLLAIWFEEENCEVLPALSGREALDLAATRQPDIAFLDLFMPPPDGLKVCAALKRLADTEVVLMTGISSRETPEGVTDADIVALLRKPFTREEALSALRAARERRCGKV